jgi:hypothetical protein
MYSAGVIRDLSGERAKNNTIGMVKNLTRIFALFHDQLRGRCRELKKCRLLQVDGNGLYTIVPDSRPMAGATLILTNVTPSVKQLTILCHIPTILVPWHRGLSPR